MESPLFDFNEDSIESIVCDNSVNLTGGEMSSDVLEVSVFYDDADERLRNTQYATQIYYIANGQTVGQYYIKSVKRTAIKKYLIQATSLIGLFERETFYGGMYDGDSFSDVLNDILFCDGLSPKYTVYYPKPTSAGYGTNVSALQASVDQWKYHLHTEFIIVDPRNSNSSFICGHWDTYEVTAGKNNYYSPVVAWNVGARYGDTSLGFGGSTDLIGNGSKVIVDINPTAGKMSIRVECKSPYDQSDTGVLYKEQDISVYETSNTCQLGFIFGGSLNNSSLGYTQTIAWERYNIYDENEDPIIVGLFIKDSSNNYYIANAVDEEKSTNYYFEPYGNAVGALTDFNRLNLMLSIADAIEYGDGVADLPIFGWIPVCSRREAMHQLLFSQNINLIKSPMGGYIFTRLTASAQGTIGDDDIYMEGSEEELSRAREVSVTEHAFSTTNLSSQVIFDNTQSDLAQGEYIAVFRNAPVYGTPTAGTGITIISSNCNVALVTGRGVITGTPYVHSQAVVKSTNTDVLDGADVSVSDTTLITSANSDNIIKKLQAYYFKKISRITNSFIYDNERCGAVYSFKTPFSEQISAFLTKVSARSSSIVKANCEFVRGYTPPDVGGYKNFIILERGEYFSIPNNVLQEDSPTIRINVIGRGLPGTNGEDGEDGEEISQTSGFVEYGGNGGDGGKGGERGLGGEIYSVTVDVTNVRTVFATQSGNVMSAETYNSQGGLIATYQSSSGLRSESGFTNIFTGVPYAVPGNNGLDGGKGGKGGGVDSSFHRNYGENGEDVGNYHGGESPDSAIDDQRDPSSYSSPNIISLYGGGGGASGGANGGNAYYTGTPHWNGGNGVHTFGGNGANGGAPIVTYSTYGCGGSGGNGGGGGGGGGVRYEYSYWQEISESYPERAGYGGSGGLASDGIDGCVIIYY